MSYGYQLCCPSCLLIPLFVQGRLHKGLQRASQEKRKKKIARS